MSTADEYRGNESAKLERVRPDWATVTTAGDAAVLRKESDANRLLLIQELGSEVRTASLEVPKGVTLYRQIHVGNRFVGWYVPDGHKLRVIAQPLRFLDEDGLGEPVTLTILPRREEDETEDETKVGWSECIAPNGSGAVVFSETDTWIQHIAFFPDFAMWQRKPVEPIVFKSEKDSPGFLRCTSQGVVFTNLYSNGMQQTSCTGGGCQTQFSGIKVNGEHHIAAVGEKILVVSRREKHAGWYYRIAKLGDLSTAEDRLLIDDAVVNHVWSEEPWVQTVSIVSTSGAFAVLALATLQGLYLYRVFETGEFVPVAIHLHN